jgi:signal transduction histidine kinase
MQHPTPAGSAPDPDADRVRTIERLAADVAHEVRTPFQSLLINLELLRGRLQAGSTGDALQRTGVIELEVRRLSSLIDAFLTILPAGAGEAEMFDVDHAIDRVAPLLQIQAREGRAEFRRDPIRAIAHAHRGNFLYALARGALALRDSLGGGGRLLLDGAADERVIRIRLGAEPLPGRVPESAPALRAVHCLATLVDVYGTIQPASGSPPTPRIGLEIALPRAGSRLTADSDRG